MGIVQGKDVLLKLYKGGVLNAVACNASCTLSVDTDVYETTFYNSGTNRTYIPNKHTAVINGSGPIFLGEPITIGDVIAWQLARSLVEFNFTLTDGADIMRVNGFGYITKSSIDGTIGQAASCDYTIQVNGVLAFYASDVTGSGDDDRVWDSPDDYFEGGETMFADPDLIDVTIVYLAREGVGIKVITSGIPTGSEVLYNSADGSFTFGTPLGAGEWIHIIYQVD